MVVAPRGKALDMPLVRSRIQRQVSSRRRGTTDLGHTPRTRCGRILGSLDADLGNEVTSIRPAVGRM